MPHPVDSGTRTSNSGCEGSIPSWGSNSTMTYLIPQRLIGKMPCMWCGEIVVMPSMSGPGVCASCDLGIKYDKSLRIFRKWCHADSEYKRFSSGQPHENFLFALWGK